MERRLVVLGAGESGVGAAILGKKKGYVVFVSDDNEIAQNYKDVLLQHEIEWEENQQAYSRILNADAAVKSPGIPETAPVVKTLRENDIPVISDIELAYRYTTANLIAITGTNGKTTVTHWLGHILKKAGLNVELAGNMGNSFAKSVAEKTPRHYVLEVSSFQLDDIVDFRPHIAILTNISPDHLDRYDYKFQNYIDAKFRITENQTEDDYFIFDGDDETIREQLKTKKIRAKKVPFSFNGLKQAIGTTIKDKTLTTKFKNRTFHMEINNLALQGQHHAKNAMAASTSANILQVRKKTLREGLKDFQGVEHRLEYFLKIQQVQYINDSKATNINSAFYALKSVPPNTIWIVGGEDKGNDYTELLPLVHQKVKGIICLGLDNSEIIKTFSNCVNSLSEVWSMQEAVNTAYQQAEKGDTVLLAPACSSYDLFKNYKDRGNQFKEAVRNL